MRKNDADSSSNTSSPNKKEFETTFETTAMIHLSSPRKNRSRQTKPLDEAFSSSDNDDEIVVTNTSESLSDGDDIDIVKDIVDIQTIGKKFEAKQVIQGAKFVCAFQSCSNAYTRKLKLQNHLTQKHGLERADQIKFYECLPEGSIDLSPGKPGPKTYVPPRFKCPTQNCTSIFSRKYDLLKHLKRCNETLLNSPEIASMKDSVLQHCKACDKVIKGGHLAKHKTQCKGNQHVETGKIKITKNVEKYKEAKHGIDANDEKISDDIDSDENPNSISNTTQNPLDRRINKYSNTTYIHPTKKQVVRESTRKVVNVMKDKLDYLGDVEDISETIQNPLDKRISKDSNKSDVQPSRIVILRDSTKKIVNVIKDKLQYVGKDSRKSDRKLNDYKAQDRYSSTCVHQNISDGLEEFIDNQSNTRAVIESEDCAVTEIQPGPSHYDFRKKTQVKNDTTAVYSKIEQLSSSDTADDLSTTIESWKVNPTELFTEISSPENSDIENDFQPQCVVKIEAKKKGKSLMGKSLVAKGKQHENANNNEPTGNLFDPHEVPDFLSLPNDDVSHIFQDKQFEEWNIAYRNWFLDKNRVASKKPNTKTVQSYASELCRYGKYVHEMMKKRNVDWNLNDLLLFNRTRGSTFNSQKGVTFFEDPTQYMIDESMPLPRKLKFLMSLVHAVEMIASTIISGKNGCTLSIEECAYRKSALNTFKEKILKQYSAISSSTFVHRQQDRLLLHSHRGNEMPSEFLKKILNIWIYSKKRRELYAKLFSFGKYLKKFCDEKRYPSLDIEKESLGMDEWPEEEVTRLRSSTIFSHDTTELRSLLELEILSLGIGHRAQIVTNIQIKDIILPSLINEEESSDIVIANTKTNAKYGLAYNPINQITLDGCLVYLRFIRTIYQGHYKTIDNWSQKSLFVTHCKNSKEQTKPSQNMDALLKLAVSEENSHLLTGKYHWSLVDLRRQAASYLNEAQNISTETKELSSFLMQHSTAIRDSTYSSISTMKKRAKEFKDGINNWITDGKEMPFIPTSSQSQFLEKSKQDLTDEFKRKEEMTRMEKHQKMASTGSQFLHKNESNWFWQFWSIPEINERWELRDKEGRPSKRGLLREFMAEFKVFEQTILRLLERKMRQNSKATINDVLDTIIASYKSFKSNSRF